MEPERRKRLIAADIDIEEGTLYPLMRRLESQGRDLATVHRLVQLFGPPAQPSARAQPSYLDRVRRATGLFPAPPPVSLQPERLLRLTTHLHVTVSEIAHEAC